MNEFIKKFLLFFILMSVALTQSGCFALFAGAAVGVGGYAWVNGDLEKELPVTVKNLHQASLKALKKLDLPVHEDSSDHLTGKIVSEFSGGKTLTIHMEALTERTSKIKIRAGIIGDKPKSEMVLNAIEKAL